MCMYVCIFRERCSLIMAGNDIFLPLYILQDAIVQESQMTNLDTTCVVEFLSPNNLLFAFAAYWFKLGRIAQWVSNLLWRIMPSGQKTMLETIGKFTVLCLSYVWDLWNTQAGLSGSIRTLPSFVQNNQISNVGMSEEKPCVAWYNSRDSILL